MSARVDFPCPCCIMDTKRVTLVASFSERRCLTCPDRCRRVPARLMPERLVDTPLLNLEGRGAIWSTPAFEEEPSGANSPT